MRIFKTALVITTLLCLISPAGFSLANEHVTPATNYTLLAPLPVESLDGEPSPQATAKTYIEGMFRLLIAVAGALAVVMIVVGGIQYMSTDSFGGKSQGKDTIQNALWGFMLAIAAWLILNTVSGGLTNFDLNIERVKMPDKVVTTGTGTGGGGPVIPGSITLADCVGNCVVVGVTHKQPMLSPNSCGRDGGCGCAYPGPCYIVSDLNDKLIKLKQSEDIFVTEAFPPTVVHQHQCHGEGWCVDATLQGQSGPENLKRFIEKAENLNLKVQFETTTESEATSLRQATGLTETHIKHIPGINGNHFSVYNRQ